MYVNLLLCHYSHKRSGRYWKFSGSIGQGTIRQARFVLCCLDGERVVGNNDKLCSLTGSAAECVSLACETTGSALRNCCVSTSLNREKLKALRKPWYTAVHSSFVHMLFWCLHVLFSVLYWTNVSGPNAYLSTSGDEVAAWELSGLSTDMHVLLTSPGVSYH